MELEILGDRFELLAQKAIHWKDQNTLLISDLHIGKVTHFRKAGIAIPAAATKQNFSRLDELLESSGVVRILILGDLFHNAYNEEWDQFSSWRNKHPGIEIIVVIGNHDILPEKLFTDIQIKIEDHLIEDQFFFTHHPLDDPDPNRFTFCGHIHPVYCLRNFVKQSLKFPCFVFDEHQAILPSFGVFTGGYEMKLADKRKIFIIAEQKIIAV